MTDLYKIWQYGREHSLKCKAIKLFNLKKTGWSVAAEMKNRKIAM